MGFADSVRSGLNQYAGFSGRATRPEYWWFILFVLLVQLVSQTIDAAVFGAGEDAGQPLSIVASLALLLPSIAVAVRRLHDIGRTGWWVLIGLVPLIGFLVLLYFYVQPSQEGPNDYGP